VSTEFLAEVAGVNRFVGSQVGPVGTGRIGAVARLDVIAVADKGLVGVAHILHRLPKTRFRAHLALLRIKTNIREPFSRIRILDFGLVTGLDCKVAPCRRILDTGN
jgi:hypothetical protein